MVDTCFGPYSGVPILDNKDPQSRGGGQGGCQGNLPRMGFSRNKEGSRLASEIRFCPGFPWADGSWQVCCLKQTRVSAPLTCRAGGNIQRDGICKKKKKKVPGAESAGVGDISISLSQDGVVLCTKIAVICENPHLFVQQAVQQRYFMCSVLSSQPAKKKTDAGRGAKCRRRCSLPQSITASSLPAVSREVLCHGHLLGS